MAQHALRGQTSGASMSRAEPSGVDDRAPRRRGLCAHQVGIK
jgi:hypothetical protein